MGGSQSWLSCDSTYPETSGAPSSDQSESGDPIIAVFMFLGTLVGLLLLTVIVHCGIVACGGCRSRRRHRRHHHHRHGADGSDIEAGAGAHATAACAAAAATAVASTAHGGDSASQGVVIVATNADGDVGAAKEDDGDDTVSMSGSASPTLSSESESSSDTSLDSTTARIASQVAHRRRSRYLDLASVARLGASPSASPVPGGAGASPDPSRRPSTGFLRPPGEAAAFDNPAFGARNTDV